MTVISRRSARAAFIALAILKPAPPMIRVSPASVVWTTDVAPNHNHLFLRHRRPPFAQTFPAVDSTVR